MSSLRENKLFEGLPDAHFERITSFIVVKTHPKDTVLIEEGIPGQTLQLLISGGVKVTKTSPEGKELLLATRKSGDFFGEMSLLEDAPRSARVITTDSCEVGVITKSAFNEMMLREPQVGLNILKAISARLRLTNDQILASAQEREALYQKQVEQLEVLIEFGKRITEGSDERTLFNLLPVVIADQIDCQQAKLFLYRRDASEVSCEEGTYSFKGSVYESLLPIKKTLQIDDMSALSGVRGAEPAGFWNNAVSMMVAPVRENQEIVGSIVITSSKKKKWSTNEEAFLTTLASYVSVVLRNIRLTQRLLMSEKLSAVGKASSSILHDFKNLLFIVYNYAKIIKGSEDPKEIHDLVEKVLESSNLMISMSREVLAYVQGDIRISAQTVNVQALVNSVLSLVEAEFKARNISVRCEIPASLEYTFDTDKISRVLYNLIINATQSIDKKKAEISIRAELLTNRLVLTVSDNGCGIPAEMQSRIFDPFITTRNEGSGLGLSICKGIVEAHTGRIEVESTEGVGTKFLLTFPYRPE